MKYKVENLTKKPDGWTCQLISWTGCYCSRTATDIFIQQEDKPTLEQIKVVARM